MCFLNILHTFLQKKATIGNFKVNFEISFHRQTLFRRQVLCHKYFRQLLFLAPVLNLP